ncbi:TRAP transporter substrate-binding protein [Hansschlegelia zhihuaiae]|uniref:Twin-arginine translocation signal domain-containing protein n=1 Tax=Hansschlegelia zhihuaiae TaxID=405005 RepID=A0A4Q0MNA2_9HYPH|nr:TRAP transporter substrate-binding protein [Hansschlegelia zhihuaiae]RXF74985.1 twin-arginine translocation signal domain-containing protein [Hansschlegelia zhihuaiae]
MERRKFISAAGVGVAGVALAAPAVAQSQPKIKWRITSSFPKSLDTIHGGAETFTKAISEMSDGNFTAQVFAAGELVPGLEAANAVTNGTVEACHTCSYYYVGKDPTFALGTAVPFGPNARQMNAWLRSGGRELLDEFYAQHNFVNLPCGNTGAQMGGWFRKEINKLDDLKGVKMRIAGLAGQTMARLGAVPQQIAGGDIYPSLEKGVIDAAEWIGPYDDHKLGFNQVAKNYMYPGWWEGGPCIHLFVNKAKWEELPKTYKAMAMGAAAIANETMLAKYDAQNPKALREIVASGVKLKPYPRDIMEGAYKASQDIYAELYAKNEWFKKIHESQTAFRNEEVLWFRVAELPFDSFMAQMQSRG